MGSLDLLGCKLGIFVSYFYVTVTYGARGDGRCWDLRPHVPGRGVGGEGGKVEGVFIFY